MLRLRGKSGDVNLSLAVVLLEGSGSFSGKKVFFVGFFIDLFSTKRMTAAVLRS